MGKKSEKLKEAEAIAPAAKTTKKKAAKAPAKKTAAKAPAASGVKKPSLKKPAFTQEDIALRAYFIAEKRQKAGLHGDAHQDWVEAERQLLAESKKKAPLKTEPKA